MPGVAPSFIQDLWIATLPQLNRGQAAQTLALSNHAGVKLLLSPGTAKRTVNDGKQYTKMIALRDADAFQDSSLFESTPANRVDVLGQMVEDWVFWESGGYVLDEREPIFNKGGSQIVDHIEEMRRGVFRDNFKSLEFRVWFPRLNSGDTKKPNGVLWHLAPVAQGTTDYVGGFNGMTGYYKSSGSSTTIGGIDRSNPDNLRSRNWCANHDGTFGANTRRTVVRALLDTDFESIPKVPMPDGRNAEFAIYVNTDFFQQYEEDVNKGPDDTEGDLARFHGNLKLRGQRIKRCAAFDTQATLQGINIQPIIGLNTQHIYGCVVPGFMKEGEMLNSYDAPRKWRVPIGGTYCIACENPRSAGFNIHFPF